MGLFQVYYEIPHVMRVNWVKSYYLLSRTCMGYGTALYQAMISVRKKVLLELKYKFFLLMDRLCMR